MAKYIVEMQMDKQEEFYFIRENESGDIVYLPSKYLMHKKRSKISPNTIRRSAFALSYYLNFLDEKQLCLDDIYQMKYIEQHEHFTDFLIWLKAGMHSREDYLKLPNNETCNAYLKEVFRFYTFMEQENKHSESLKVLSDTQMIVRNSIGIRKVLNRKSFRGYLKEKGHQGKTIEQDKIVVLLQECANSRDQVLLLLLAETGFRIGELLGVRYAEDICHCLRGDGCCSKRGYSRLDCQFSQLKHAVLDPRRDSKSQNTADHAPVRADLEVITDNNRLTVFSQLVENYHCTENTGNQCGDCRAGNTKMKYPDQNGISTNIHNIGDHGNHHRPPGVLLGTENRCRGIIRRNKRE